MKVRWGISGVTRDEHLALFRYYDKIFHKWPPERCAKDYQAPVGMGRGIKHARWMMQEMIRRIEENTESSPGQADRWVGFMQGILWTQGFYSIADMATHNVLPSEDE